MTPAIAAQLLADTKPRAPLLPDGKIPMDEGRCVACGCKPRPFAPGSDDHDDECEAEREWWRWKAACLALSCAAPDLAAAYVALADRTIRDPKAKAKADAKRARRATRRAGGGEP